MYQIMIVIFRNYLKSYQGMKSQCLQYIICNFINSISIGVCFFLSLYFVKILKFEIMSAGILMSCYGLGTVLGGLCSGKLCDILDNRKVLLASLLMQGLAFLMLTVITSYLLLMCTLLMLGFSTYGFKTANSSRLLSQCNSSDQFQLKALNISNVADNLGLGISGIMIGILLSHGFHNIFFMSASLIFGLVTYEFLIKNTVPISISIAQKCDSENDKKAFILYFSLLSIFLIGLIVAQLGSTYPLYIQDAFPVLGGKAVSILFTLDTFLIVLFQAPLSAWCSRFNVLLIMGVGALAMGIGMFMLSMMHVFSFALVSCAIWTFGEMLFFPSAQLLCYKNGGGVKKGQVIGLYQAAFALSAVLGPSIGTYFYSIMHHNAMWYLSMFIGTFCFTTCLYIFNKEQKLQIANAYAAP